MIRFPWYLAVGLDVAFWTAWGLATGLVVHRLPGDRVDHDTWLWKARRWERDGRAYTRVLRVNRWQRRLPEAGAFFGGGDKRRIGGRATATLEAYAAETRRAELVHWLGVVITPVFAIWNPAPLFAAMLAYAVIANGPCIASLRANRLRLSRVLAARQRRQEA